MTDRRRTGFVPVALIVALCALGLLSVDPLRAADSDSAVIVLVRHAEKQVDTDDPGLTRRGRRRAARLAQMLGSAGVDRLFASEFRRTQQTLAPLARAMGLEIETRPGRAIDELARELRELDPGTLAVVAGHSNTVPAIIRALGVDPKIETLPEAAHDRIFVVMLGASGASGATLTPGLLELRFDP